jgi:hypothetical protein
LVWLRVVVCARTALCGGLTDSSGPAVAGPRVAAAGAGAAVWPRVGRWAGDSFWSSADARDDDVPPPAGSAYATAVATADPEPAMTPATAAPRRTRLTLAIVRAFFLDRRNAE